MTTNAANWLGSELNSMPEIKTEVRFWDSCATLTDEQMTAGKRDQLAPVKPAPATPVKTPASTFKVPAETVAGKYAVDRTVRPL